MRALSRRFRSLTYGTSSNKRFDVALKTEPAVVTFDEIESLEYTLMTGQNGIVPRFDGANSKIRMVWDVDLLVDSNDVMTITSDSHGGRIGVTETNEEAR